MRTLIILILLISSKSFAQNSKIEANFIIEPNEPSYGSLISYNYDLYKSSKHYRLSSGVYGDFIRTNETVDDEGTAGYTFSSQLGLQLTNEFRFLKKEQLFLNMSAYGGWGYRETKVNLSYPQLNVNSDYATSYNHFAAGLIFRSGYRFSNNLGAQFLIKYDFSRVLDKYRNVLGEKPGFIYGFGLTYSF